MTFEIILESLNACVPLRRQSYSAPPSISIAKLDICLDRVNCLTAKVDRLTASSQKLRSRSLVEVRQSSTPGRNPPSLAMGDDKVEQLPSVKPRTCHKCHCPLNDPHHAGMQSGIDNCTLDHWPDCPGDKEGGRDGSGKIWEACPTQSSNNLKKNDSHDQKTSQTKLPASLEEAVKIVENIDDKFDADRDSVSSDDSSDEEELRIQ